jgi:hypothetical protein
MLERAAVGKISRYCGRSKSVAADRFGDAGRHSAPEDHSPGIALAHRLFGEHPAVAATRREEQPAFSVFGDAGRVDVGV